MSEVKWIKIVTDIFDDEKILLIEQLPDADTVIVIWFKLLCLAGKQNNSGVFMIGSLPCTDEMLATIFRRPLSTVRLALNTFEKLGMIEVINECITIPKWGKYQNLEGLESRREYMREYMKEYRNKQKMLSDGREDDVNIYDVNEVNNDKSLVSTLDKKRIDKNREDKNNSKSASRFTAPTLEQVKAYCQERNNGIDAERWLDYYESVGWKVGRNPMKDWKAAVRTWERNGVDKKPTKENPALQYEQRDYSDDDYQSGDYMTEAREFMEKMKGAGK